MLLDALKYARSSDCGLECLEIVGSIMTYHGSYPHVLTPLSPNGGFVHRPMSFLHRMDRSGDSITRTSNNSQVPRLSLCATFPPAGSPPPPIDTPPLGTGMYDECTCLIRPTSFCPCIPFFFPSRPVSNQRANSVYIIGSERI